MVEESIVDPSEGTMVTRTKNLNHQRQMTVEEIQTYTKSPENDSWTLIDTQAIFHCKFRWAAGRLEGMGVKRFKEHFAKSREAMLYVLERLRGPERAH